MSLVSRILERRASYYLISLLIVAIIQLTLYYNCDNLTLWSTYRFYYDLGLTPYQIFKINEKLFTSYQLGMNIYMWFAYPPGAFYLLILFALPYKLFHIQNLHIQVILGRLQSIVAYYLLAIFGYYFVKKECNDEERAKRFEKLLIFNPLVILASVLVGLFDAWVAFLSLVAIYFLFRKRYDYAGFVLGIASMIKQTALILITPFIIYILKNFGFRAALKFLVFYLIAAFLLLFPLINQLPQIIDVAVLFHLERPAAVFNINMIFYLPLLVDRLLHLNEISVYTIAKIQEISALIIVGLFTLILSFNLLIRKRKFSKFEFLYYTALFYFVFLFGYKIVSPQHFIIEYMLLLLLYIYSGNRRFLKIALWLSLLGVSLMLAYIFLLGADILVNYQHVLDEKLYLNMVATTVKLVNLIFTSLNVEFLILFALTVFVLILAKRSYLPLLEMLLSATRLKIRIDSKASSLSKALISTYVVIALIFSLMISLPQKFIYAQSFKQKFQLIVEKLNSSSQNTSFIKIEFDASISSHRQEKNLQKIVIEYYNKNFKKYVCFTSDKYYLDPASCQL
jgi:hypothetical protein